MDRQQYSKKFKLFVGISKADKRNIEITSGAYLETNIELI